MSEMSGPLDPVQLALLMETTGELAEPEDEVNDPRDDCEWNAQEP
jgi:hypothetical protein